MLPPLVNAFTFWRHIAKPQANSSNLKWWEQTFQMATRKYCSEIKCGGHRLIRTRSTRAHCTQCANGHCASVQQVRVHSPRRQRPALVASSYETCVSLQWLTYGYLFFEALAHHLIDPKMLLFPWRQTCCSSDTGTKPPNLIGSFGQGFSCIFCTSIEDTNIFNTLTLS